jgi:hypothetical protein
MPICELWISNPKQKEKPTYLPDSLQHDKVMHTYMCLDNYISILVTPYNCAFPPTNRFISFVGSKSSNKDCQMKFGPSPIGAQLRVHTFQAPLGVFMTHAIPNVL